MPLSHKAFGYRHTSELLHKAGVPKTLIPEMLEVTKHTIERWLDQEIEQRNLPLVLQLVKAQEEGTGTHTLLEELKDLLIAKFIVRLKLEYPQARTSATTLVPMVLKRLVELLRQNPQFNSWKENLSFKNPVSSSSNLRYGIQA